MASTKSFCGIAEYVANTGTSTDNISAIPFSIQGTHTEYLLLVHLIILFQNLEIKGQQ